VQQNDAPLGPVAFGCRLEHVHQAHQRDVEPEHGVLAVINLVAEEVVPNQLLLVVDVLLGAVGDHHVVDALERVARDLRALTNDGQVVFEAALPS